MFKCLPPDAWRCVPDTNNLVHSGRFVTVQGLLPNVAQPASIDLIAWDYTTDAEK